MYRRSRRYLTLGGEAGANDAQIFRRLADSQTVSHTGLKRGVK